jgi:hypothetical protein
MQIDGNLNDSYQMTELKSAWRCPSMTRIDIKHTLSTTSFPANDGVAGYTDV